MKIKKILVVFLVSIFMFGETSQAEQIPTSNTLKQGVYNISDEHKGYYRNIKLITPDKPVTIILLDSNGAQVLFARISNEKEELKVGPIKIGETLIITGEGEIAIVH